MAFRVEQPLAQAIRHRSSLLERFGYFCFGNSASFSRKSSLLRGRKTPRSLCGAVVSLQLYRAASSRDPVAIGRRICPCVHPKARTRFQSNPYPQVGDPRPIPICKTLTNKPIAMEGKRTKAKKSFSIDAIISAYESDGDGSTTSHGSGDYDHSRERRPSPANKSPMETKSQQSSELRRGDEHSPSSRASCTPPTTPPQRPAPILAGNLSPATSLQMQMMGNVQAAAAAQAALFGAGAGGHLFPTAPGLPAHQQGQPGAGSSNASAAAANIQAALASYTLFQHQQQQMANSHLQQHHHHHHQMAQAQAQAQANQRAMAMDGFFNPWLSSLSARHGHHRLLPGLGGSHGLSGEAEQSVGLISSWLTTSVIILIKMISSIVRMALPVT